MHPKASCVLIACALSIAPLAAIGADVTTLRVPSITANPAASNPAAPGAQAASSAGSSARAIETREVALSDDIDEADDDAREIETKVGRILDWCGSVVQSIQGLAAQATGSAR